MHEVDKRLRPEPNPEESQVDEETANGVAVFVESAFVNVGKVRVVDRQNVQRILEEHEVLDL